MRPADLVSLEFRGFLEVQVDQVHLQFLEVQALLYLHAVQTVQEILLLLQVRVVLRDQHYLADQPFRVLHQDLSLLQDPVLPVLLVHQ